MNMARAKALLAHDPLRRWTAADANDTYNIPRWGCGYFGVNEQGNLIVTPRGEGNGAIDMKECIDELDNIHRVSERVKIKPQLGFRARLSSRGAGRWEQSGGDFSKFGLSAAEMVDSVDKLKAWGETDTLKLLHFHLGSQISAIKSVKNALREAGRLFSAMNKLAAKGLRYMDVGGGLSLDPDRSQTSFA